MVLPYLLNLVLIFFFAAVIREIAILVCVSDSLLTQQCYWFCMLISVLKLCWIPISGLYQWSFVGFLHINPCHLWQIDFLFFSVNALYLLLLPSCPGKDFRDLVEWKQRKWCFLSSRVNLSASLQKYFSSWRNAEFYPISFLHLLRWGRGFCLSFGSFMIIDLHMLNSSSQEWISLGHSKYFFNRFCLWIFYGGFLCYLYQDHWPAFSSVFLYLIFNIRVKLAS